MQKDNRHSDDSDNSVDDEVHSNRLDAIVNKLVYAKDRETVQKTYHEWAATYEQDLHSFGYVAPQIVADQLEQHVSDKNADILDAGCGTGLVGILLHNKGYHNLHGRDFSQTMLDEAQLHNCYQTLEFADYAKKLDCDDHAYDAIVSAGVYSKQLGEIFLSEMLRILKPGGVLVLSVREHYIQELGAFVTAALKGSQLQDASIAHRDYMQGQKARAFYFSLVKAEQIPE